MQERTKQAIEHIGISEQSFGMSMQMVVQDPIYARKMQEHDAMLSKKTDIKDGNFTESRDEIKKILLDKTKMEGELQLKLTTMQAPNQQMAQQIALMERTKMIDTLYIKYNMRLNYILAAAERH